MSAKIDPQALFSFSYGLYVVTSCCGEKLNGQISNTVFQVCDDPPYVATCVSRNALTHECILKSGAFAVSVLQESTPLKFIGLFGFRSGRDVDKLSQVEFEPGVTGCPVVLENAVAVIEAKVTDRVDLDSHSIFVAKVVRSEQLKDGKPLTYAYYRENLRGKTPKNAPTHFADKTRESSSKADEVPERGGKTLQKYVCDVCEWVYDPEIGDPDAGVEPGTAFEDIPDDWVCPVCGVGKDKFSPVD